MKKVLIFLICILLLGTPAWGAEALPETAAELDAHAAVLMDVDTGTVLYEKNALEELPPASVTKVMTMLLVAEAVDSGQIALTDTVTASARASSMGGSEIWLEEGEQFSVEEMFKCVAVVSANDCAVALAEYLCGSEAAFVERMNARAKELGLTHTNFNNCTGLFEDEGHYTCAYDLAVISRELLLHHSWVTEYTTIWMDTIRDGEFGLSNTNKLLRSYDGLTGLKTGYTSTAGHCLAASAERDGVAFVAVVLGGSTSAARFQDCRTLLDLAYASFTTVPLAPPEALAPIPLHLGTADSVQPMPPQGKALISRSAAGEVSDEVVLPESLRAPVAQGETLGKVVLTAGGEVVAEAPLVAAEGVEALGPGGLLLRLCRLFLGYAA